MSHFQTNWMLVTIDLSVYYQWCRSEVRQFLTSAANHEIAKTEVSFIPYGISPKPLDSDFIQEGADNIDLNTETIDGKNTMHSMARAVFQVVQDYTPTSEISSTKIKRGQD